MHRPGLCLLCGRLRGPGEDDASTCAGCGEPPPEVGWQSTDSYRPGQRAGLVLLVTIAGLVVSGVALLIAYRALRARSFDGSSLLQLGLAAFLLFAAGMMFWAGGYTAFVRTYRFESSDGRVFGDVSTLLGRVWTAFGLSYTLHPVDIARVPGAAQLTSARAFAAGPDAMCAQLAALGDADRWRFVDGDTVVMTAAILGMAARSEIEILRGEPRRFWIRNEPEKVSPVRDKIWARIRGGDPSLAFEQRFVHYLGAFVQQGAPSPSPGVSYRIAAPTERPPFVPLALVIEHLGLDRTGDTEDDLGDHLRALFAGGAATSGEGVAEALLGAAALEPTAASAIALDVLDGMEVAG